MKKLEWPAAIFCSVKKILDFKIDQTNFYTSKTFRFILKLISLLKLRLSREQLIRFLLKSDKDTKQMHIIGLLNLINKKI